MAPTFGRVLAIFRSDLRDEFYFQRNIQKYPATTALSLKDSFLILRRKF